MRLVRLEELARMRLEHHGAGQPAMLGHCPARRLEQGLMAAMHAVEVADRQRRPPRFVGHVIVSVDDVHAGG